jgi:AraC-like DNA-binding protein
MARMLTAAAAVRFQESAAPARLFAWGARALYIGPAERLSAHRNAVAVLTVGLEHPFFVAERPEDEDGPYRACRAVLIPPDTEHHYRETAGLMACLYVDPRSRDFARLWASARVRGVRAAFEMADEPEILALLSDLAAGRRKWELVRRGLSAFLAGPADGDVDPRVRAALSAIHANAGARLTLDVLARNAGLSPSRFRRQFHKATGVTIRRYRLWAAMGAATRAIARGESLTGAALDAGFSSSAHFSAAFREMFGFEPSRFAKGRLSLG